jgi:hypothetical protein
MHKLSELPEDHKNVVSLSVSKQAILIAWRRGYRVNRNGELISHTGRKRVCNKERKLASDSSGYMRFTVRVPTRLSLHRSCRLRLHQFVAYQKFGDESLGTGIQARHSPDSDRCNNRPSNIKIGTKSDNAMDVPKEIRVRSATNAGKASAKKSRKLSNAQARSIVKQNKKGKSTRWLAAKFDVSKSVIQSITSGRRYRDAFPPDHWDQLKLI